MLIYRPTVFIRLVHVVSRAGSRALIMQIADTETRYYSYIYSFQWFWINEA